MKMLSKFLIRKTAAFIQKHVPFQIIIGSKDLALSQVFFYSARKDIVLF